MDAEITRLCIAAASRSSTTPVLRRRRLWSGRWRGKLGVVHGNILLELFHLNGELVARPRERPPERDLQTICWAIIRIVNLRGIAAQWGFRIADQAKQKARLLVEVETERRLPFLESCDEIGIVPVDFFTRVHAKFFVKSFHVQREIKVGVDACSGIFCRGHPMHASGNA